MKSWVMIYNLVSFAAFVVQLGFLIFSLCRKDRFRRIFGTMLTFSMLTLVTYNCFLNAPTHLTAMIFHTAFAGAFLCSNLCISLFVMRYTQTEKYMLNVIRITGLFLVLFLGFYVYNAFSHLLYDVERVTIMGTEIWTIKPAGLIWLYYLVSALLSLQIMAQLIVRVVVLPKIYKYRYILLAIVYGGIWSIRGVLHILSAPIDVSVLVFTFFAGFTSLIVIYGAPKKLTERMVRMANNSMNDGLLCYDNTGKPIFSNAAAKKLFAAERNPLKAMRAYRINRVDHAKENSSYEEVWEETFVLDGQEHIYDVRYIHIREHDQIVGSYLQFTDKTEELLMFEQQRYQATHDGLTGIYNRERFFREAEKRKNEFPNIPWMILVSNIRDFRLVNELFGEEVGDAILVREAENFRKYAHRSSLYGRIMDDRFALLMDKRYFSPDIFMECIDDVRKITDEKNFRMHVQVGIYEVTDPTENIVLIYDKAILALPNIASEYQKVFAYYDSNRMEERLKEHQIIEDFDHALEHGEFQIFLQAQFDKEGKVLGADSLPCVASEERGILAGKDLYAALEHSGVVHKMNEFLWNRAAELLHEWKITHPDWYISIHISAKDLYFTNVLEFLQNLLDQHEIRPQNLHVEIDEATLMMDPKNNVTLLNELQKMGLFIIISEFGNGYSSLNMLKDMHPDAIRLDHMVDPEDGDETRGYTVIKAILSMAQKLGIQTIISDIQNEAEHHFIKENGGDIYQGTYYAFPATVDEFVVMTEWTPD